MYCSFASRSYYIIIWKSVNDIPHRESITHPADDLEEALWQFARLSPQQRNVWIHSKQLQLSVFLHTVKACAFREKFIIHPSQLKFQSISIISVSKKITAESSERVGFSPSDSSLRKLLGMSGCIMSPPSENTVFIVSMNHSLSGAYVQWFIGKYNKCNKQSIKDTLWATGRVNPRQVENLSKSLCIKEFIKEFCTNLAS